MPSLNIPQEFIKRYVFRTLDWNDKNYVYKADLISFCKKELSEQDRVLNVINSTLAKEDGLISYERFLNIYDLCIANNTMDEKFLAKVSESMTQDLRLLEKKSFYQAFKEYKFGTEYDNLWLFILVGILILIVSSVNDIFSLRKEVKQLGKGAALHPFSDLWVSAVAAVATFIIKIVLFNTLDAKVNHRLAMARYPDHAARKERVHDYIFGSWFYLLSTMFTFYTYWGSPNIPNYMGGSGTGFYFVKNWPSKLTPFVYLNIYYPIQIGYHFHNLLLQIFYRTHKKTYIEICLHHIITLMLIFYSYFTNMETFGITVMMVHDLGDGIMNLGKVVRDLDLMGGWKIDLMYGLIIATWLYPRVIVAWLSYLPHALSLIFEIGDASAETQVPGFKFSKHIGFWLQAISLCILSVLNLYWIILIIGVGCLKSKNKGYIAEFQGENAKIESDLTQSQILRNGSENGKKKCD